MPQKNTHFSSKKIFVVIGIIVVIIAIIFALSRRNNTANIEIPTSTTSISEVSSIVSASENAVDSTLFAVENYSGYWFNGSHSTPYYIQIVPYENSGIETDVYSEYRHWHFIIPDIAEAYIPADPDKEVKDNRIWLNFENCTCTSYDGKDSTPYIEGWMIFDFEKNTVYVSDVSVDFYYPISEDNFNDAVYELSGAYPSNGAVNSPSAADNIASTDWKKEYLDFISTNDSDYSYMLADLDGNSIPELFAFEDGIGDIYWYAPGNGFGDTNLDCTVMSGYDPIYYVTKGSYSIIFALTYDGYCIGQFQGNDYSTVAIISAWNASDGSTSYSLHTDEATREITADEYDTLPNDYMNNLAGSDWWDVRNEAYSAYSASEISTIIQSY